MADSAAAPDDACIEAMKEWQFAVPAEQVTIELAPFPSDTFGIQGVVPRGWTEAAQPGVYARGSSAVNVVAVIEQAAQMTTSGLLDLPTQQLGLGTAPASVGQREANSLTWSL